MATEFYRRDCAQKIRPQLLSKILTRTISPPQLGKIKFDSFPEYRHQMAAYESGLRSG